MFNKAKKIGKGIGKGITKGVANTGSRLAGFAKHPNNGKTGVVTPKKMPAPGGMMKRLPKKVPPAIGNLMKKRPKVKPVKR